MKIFVRAFPSERKGVLSEPEGMSTDVVCCLKKRIGNQAPEFVVTGL